MWLHHDTGDAGQKTFRLLTIGATASVFGALVMMAEHNIGALIVLDDDRVVGVFSELDSARKAIIIGKASRETLVREIMSSPAATIDLTTNVSQCMDLMTGRFIRHLPVVESGFLVGCISISDFVKTLIVEQGRWIIEFESYVRGDYPAETSCEAGARLQAAAGRPRCVRQRHPTQRRTTKAMLPAK